MHDDLKLETRDKVLQKMSRNGAVEENASRGTTKSVSGRIAEITFEKETAPGSDLEWGRGAKASGGEKMNGRQSRSRAYNDSNHMTGNDSTYQVEAPARNTEEYLDSLLAQVGVETGNYSLNSHRHDDTSVTDSSRVHSNHKKQSIRLNNEKMKAAVSHSDSEDIEGMANHFDNDYDAPTVTAPEDILHEHRSSLSQKGIAPTEKKLSEKEAYKKKIQKDTVKRFQEKRANPLNFNDEVKRSERVEMGSVNAGTEAFPHLDARGRKVTEAPNAKEIIKKKLKNKQQRELVTYGGVTQKISDTVASGVHQKVRENEDDNSSVEAAHESEIVAEKLLRSTESRLHQGVQKRKSKLKFEEAPEKAIDKAETKFETDFAVKSSEEKVKAVDTVHNKLSEKSKASGAYKNSTGSANASSKGEAKATSKKAEANKKLQKKKIKQSYADAFRGKSSGASSKLMDGTKEAVKGGLEKTGEVIADFVRKNYGAVIALACVGILFLIILAGSGTVATMMTEAGNSFVESTYSATDDDILNNDESYTEMEDELQDQIDNIETTYSGYDEYRYQVDEISHDPYALASYFTAKYGNFRAADVESELLPLFQEQYILTLTEEVEIRTRTVTDPDTGEESEQEYEWYVLNVKLVNKGVDTVARAHLTDKQLLLYNAYQATKGNRSYLFGEHPIAGNVSGGGLSYDIPPEALEDEAFARMIDEAEKYLGREYVWGGSSPSTGFDCSGFVSWVINHSGNGWNVGRQTANGLMNHCTYVSSSNAKPGDLIFFEKTYNTTGASHVGIYVGDGMMIHCGNPIQYTSIESNYWRQHFLSFGRIN